MADLLDFAVTPTGRKNIPGSIPTLTISGRIVDSATQTIVLADLTGANAIAFPNVFTTLTDEQMDELVHMVAIWLLYQKAGL